MDTDNGRTKSAWMSVDTPLTEALSRDMQADVCIVGGGIAGLTTAYLLLKEGRKVLVLEDGFIAGGESSRTSAHLGSVIDAGFAAIERVHSTKTAQLVYQSHAAAIDTIERITRDEGIECDFQRVDGFLWAPPEGSTQDLHEELQAAQRAGLASAEWVDRAPLPDFDTGR